MDRQQSSESISQMLVESKLLPEVTVEELQRHFPVQTRSADGFLSLLLSRNLLTPWQAKQLRSGRHRGFKLGSYILKSHLARGGMSTLYVVEHIETRKSFALKVLPPSKASEASYLSRFQREADLAAQLNHENIMKVYDVSSCTENSQTIHFMVMELLHGRDLFNAVATDGPLSIRNAAEVIRQAAVGLQYAHDRGLVHRDVKPGNLFLANDGTTKIVDLGLAAVLEGQAESLTRQHDERVLGTADYLAPEQAVDSHRVDSRADIYALGCAFYYALTGRPPFTDGTLAQRILAHQQQHPRSVTEFRGDVPMEIQSLLQKMLVKRRGDRIQTCREVAETLEAWALRAIEDSSIDRPVQLMADNLSSSRRRKLKRLKKRVVPQDTPTASIRSADTSTANYDEPSRPHGDSGIDNSAESQQKPGSLSAVTYRIDEYGTQRGNEVISAMNQAATDSFDLAMSDAHFEMLAESNSVSQPDEALEGVSETSTASRNLLVSVGLILTFLVVLSLTIQDDWIQQFRVMFRTFLP